MSQLLRLRKLCAEVLADLKDVDGTGTVPTEYELRKLAGIRTPERQAAEYRRLCGVEAGRAPSARPGRAPTRSGSIEPGVRGGQFLA